MGCSTTCWTTAGGVVGWVASITWASGSWEIDLTGIWLLIITVAEIEPASVCASDTLSDIRIDDCLDDDYKIEQNRQKII